MSARAVVPARPAAKAHLVPHASVSLLQHKCESGGSACFEIECEDCKKKKKLQRQASGTGPATPPPIVHDVLRSPGQPLDEQTRSFFETRFGHDFSQVRVHTDSRAAESARAVKAQAYAIGHDLVFGAGRFAPDTTPGRRLLAHELTHVVQQNQGRDAKVQRKIELGPANDAMEQEADRFAEALTSGRSLGADLPNNVPSRTESTQIQRQTGTSSTGGGGSSSPSICTQQDIDDIKAEALTWLDDIYNQLLVYYVDEEFAQPGATPSRDHLRIAGAVQQAFNTTDLTYIEVIRRRFLHIAEMLRERGRVRITCGGSGCAASGSSFTAAYVQQPYALILCSPGVPGNRPISTFIHELGHAVLPQIGIHNTVALGGGIRDRAYTSERVFKYLSPEETLDNAESYGVLAELLHKRVNTQIVAQPTDTTTGCRQPDQPRQVMQAFARAEQWNRYAVFTLSDYVRFLGNDPITNLPHENLDPLLNVSPTLDTAGLTALFRGYQSLFAHGFNVSSWDVACASGSNCGPSTLGYTDSGRISATAVSLTPIRAAHPINLCPAWFSLSDDDKIRSIYALFLIGRPSWIVANFKLAEAYSYVNLARAIALQRAPAPTTKSALEHILQDKPTARLRPKASGPTPATAPPIVHAVLGSPGRPLEDQTRSVFEPLFGHDFSKVRVHTDARASESAQAVRARAYTVGDDLVFSAGEFAPRTTAGRKLLAHELTHVVQQSNRESFSIQRRLAIGPTNDSLEQEADHVARWITGDGRDAVGRLITPPRRGTDAVVWRQPVLPQPVEQYETKYLKGERPELEKAAEASYWWRTVEKIFDVTVFDNRLNDPEERDAVLSALWQNRPSGELSSVEIRDVAIPVRASSGSKPLTYRFKFIPKDPSKPDGKDKVQIMFLQESISAPIVASQSPADFVSTIGYGYRNFPGDDATKYWNEHPREKDYLFYWIEKKSPAKFDQVVTAETAATQAGKKVTRRTSFSVSGKRDNQGYITSVTVTFLGAFSPQTQQTPADYHAKDYGDTLIEQAQAQPDPKKGDKLGKVTIPPSVPTHEVLPVKYYVANYFTVIGTRNAEVDAVIPMPHKTTSVLYTLRFRPNNDVDVERIGEQGKDAKAGQVDPDKLDVARSPEFANQSKDVPTFKGWLKKRYPKVSASGTTVEELRDNINKEAENNADKPPWFDNYGITILNDKEGEARLHSVHGYEKERVKDMKTFLPRELKLLESVLETMTLKALAFFKFLRMTRQRMAIFKKLDDKGKPILDDKKKLTFEERPDLGGLTESRWVTSGGHKTTNTTIIIFDSGADNPVLFIGGKEGVLPRQAFIFGHELGHVVGNTGVQHQFNAFVKKKNIKPITHYAETGGQDKGGPEKEFFPEAFALFQEDPEWMRTNLPELHAWFDTLVKTGKPPKL